MDRWLTISVSRTEGGLKGPSSVCLFFTREVWEAKMLNRLRTRTNGESGFTLVELLVVMLILGLLAAIGIPAFFSQREKAHDVDAKQAAGTAGRAAETIAVNNGGVYNGPDGVSVPNLINIEKTLNDANLSVVATTAKTYTVRVTADSGHTFDYSRDASGRIATACSPAGQGGCPSDGTWN
jgi:type IV pilus assembly protein PilA